MYQTCSKYLICLLLKTIEPHFLNEILFIYGRNAAESIQILTSIDIIIHQN